MIPSQAPTGEAASPQNLEDRLRGLLVSSVSSRQTPDSMQHPTIPYLPPHLSMASPEDQQAYLARVSPRAQEPRDPSIVQETQGHQAQPGRKRPNQAQRRQMNSQLSIPVDTRLHQNVHYAGGHGNRQQSWSTQNYNGGPQSQSSQRFSQQLPQFQSPASPYSPHVIYQQGAQASPREQHAGNHQFLPRQTQHWFQQRQQTRKEGALDPPGAYSRTQPQHRQLYQPGASSSQGRSRPPVRYDPEDLANQSAYLEKIVLDCVQAVGIDSKEEAEKENFRIVVEQACREAITAFEQQELGHINFDPLSVELKCFGSMSSGFATKASDMDLALLSPRSQPAADSPESRIPRILEKKLLDIGYGARLLTRTRVPIIKLCEKPTERLRNDLLEERKRWEAGFTEDEDGVAHTTESEEPIDVHEVTNEKSSTSPIASPSEPSSRKSTLTHGDHLAQLKQKQNQSLVDYYNNAKRILRNMGGFDLSFSSPQPNIEQSKVLNSVCKAFISGLSSESLFNRLRNYKSISPLFEESVESSVHQRSLYGLWVQIEGERLAMAFDSRPLTEANEQRELACLAHIKDWQQLSDTSGPLTESQTYNRQLYTAYGKLKNMSSLALVFLEQIQHEQPSYYAARAQRLLDDLRRTNYPDSDSVTPIVIAHYVSGIRNSQIREDMQKMDFSQHSFKKVVLQHKALQIAVDLEHAVNKGLYADEDCPYVKQYIDLIRGRNIGSESQPIDDALLRKIRTLPDPTVISQNKPRDRYSDRLEFPKTDIGVQCDINFSADLALHNTLLLRCYSCSDPRVRIMTLFVKHWAKVRGINTPYRGTLSSYGYVLMVLHYLVNVAVPFVCPNLQELRIDPAPYLPPAEIEARTACKGRDVRFWRNEAEIKNLANRGLLNQNKDSVGCLLRGFFEYFANNSTMSTDGCRGFDWGREVLSLRSHGGILTKQEKGWTGAKTVVETSKIAAPPTPSTPTMNVESSRGSAEAAGAVSNEEVEARLSKMPIRTVEETKEIRHRYLFAIEDPFELDHNVARTVTHNGIVSIRDEFRRAWRIIKTANKIPGSEQLLDPVLVSTNTNSGFLELLDQIHGKDTGSSLARG